MSVDGPVLLPSPRSMRLGDRAIAAVDAGSVPVDLDPSLPREGYRLTIDAHGARVTAADPPGARHARATLAQLTVACDGVWPHGEVADHPDLLHRGVMVDISRDRVPTLDTLAAVIGRLGSWKVNGLQLYVEHAVAYAGHEVVWRGASAYSPAEVAEVRELASRAGITLTANQNCLGHMERWLRHDPYRDLALAPDGYLLAGLLPRIPSTIDPALPGSLALVRDLLGQLLELHDGDFVHVGLDEPWELPPDRGDDYLAWLTTLRSLPELDGLEMLVWGDFLAAHPELIGALPDGVTVCEWGYEALSPFERDCARLAGAGRAMWVAPGTSAWWSLLGRSANMRANVDAAADAARAHGATGWLLTEWGDNGHLQPLCVAEPGMAYGAAMAWCAEANRHLDLAAALDLHCFGDTSGRFGAALLAVGDTALRCPVQLPNMAANVLHLYLPQLPVGRGILDGMDVTGYRAVLDHLDDVDAQLTGAALGRGDAETVHAELALAMDLTRFAAEDALARLDGDGSLASIPASVRARLEAEMRRLAQRHRDVWALRSRPGGLEDSVAWLTHVADCHRSGEVDPIWSGPWQTRR